MLHRALPLLIIATVLAASERTVCDSERGMIFGDAWGDQYDRIGLNVDVLASPDFARQRPESIKVSHGRFHLAGPQDDSTWPWFPYAELVAYESAEVAAGRPPLFATATWQGKRRPVLWSWSLGFVAAGQTPTTDPSTWRRALNVGDERYARFWIHEYAIPKLLGPLVGTPNMWIGCDECAFRYDLFGVLDDAGRWVPNVPWDAPFPHDGDAYLAAVNAFFANVARLAPQLEIMCNDGGVEVDANASPLAAFQAIYAHSAAGLMQEDGFYYYPLLDAWGRGEFRSLLERYAWFGTTGKVLDLRFLLAHDADYAAKIATAYATYLLCRGDNSFFAPMYGDDPAYPECAPADYAAMRDRLGLPIAALASEGAADDGFRLYSRVCQGGIVYLNWTGASRQVVLPAGGPWHLAGGATVDRITLADRAAAYVTALGGATAPRPAIAPRLAGTISGPVRVTLGSDAPGATIRYTVDGSVPGAGSPAYTAPIALAASARVRARAFVAGMNPSCETTAAYAITPTAPTVAFDRGFDYGSERLTHADLVVRLDHASATEVRVAYAAAGGSATAGADYALAPGTLVFAPGETAKTIALAIVEDAVPEPTETVVVQLGVATGATVGQPSAFTYSIEDDDGGPRDVAPTTPLALTATASGTVIDIAWQAAIDDAAVLGYRLYRDGALIADTAGVSLVDADCRAATRYAYAVEAYDGTGNVSARSAEIAVTTPAAGGTTTAPVISGHVYSLRAEHSGKALDVAGGPSATANGANVQQWSWWGGTNQRWRVAREADGTYTLTALHSGKVLDVANASPLPGGNVIQWADHAGADQRWRIADLGSGWCVVTNVGSGLVLDVQGGVTATQDGANVEQRSDAGADNERWRFLDVGLATPFGGSPRAIPGRIEAEDFDDGGEGVAYHDDDPTNDGGAYRATGVDIRGSRDAGGGQQVGWFHAGEWLQYTTRAATAGTYSAAVRVANGDVGGTCHLEIDGVDVTGALSTTNTGGWDSFTTLTHGGVAIGAGVHAVRLVCDRGAVDVNWWSFSGAATTAPTATVARAEAEDPAPTPTAAASGKGSNGGCGRGAGVIAIGLAIGLTGRRRRWNREPGRRR